jgi:uncharacterized protein (TIGR02246 family)
VASRGPLSPEEIEAVRQAGAAYPAAWLANDFTAVMESLAHGAVLAPHHGDAPVEGLDAIRQHFWPPDGPPFTVTRFTMTPAEIDGVGDLAYVRGRMSMVFSIEADGTAQTFANEGNYLMILRRQDSGVWRIARYIWNDPVPLQQ